MSGQVFANDIYIFAVVYCHLNIADMCCPLHTNTNTNKETKANVKDTF